MEENQFTESGTASDDEFVHLVIPFSLPTNSTGLESALLDSDDEVSLEEIIPLDLSSSDSPMIFQAVHDDPSVTLEEFSSNTGLDPDGPLTCAAECGAFWKRLGVEAVIYTCSFGGIGFVTGLLMKFAKADPLFGTLFAGGTAVLANENAKIVFQSLLNPPGEQIPEENRDNFDMVKKYAFYPLAVLFSSGVSGTGLWMIGDPDLGTRLALGGFTAQLGGPVTGLAHSAVRNFYGGTVIVNPERPGVKEAMARYYSTEPNEGDQGRPFLAGNIRNATTRVVAVSAAALTAWYSGLYFIETYCGEGGAQRLDNITNGAGNYTGEDIANNCFFGGATFLVREASVGMVKVISLLVVQPAANWAFNKVFDFFYGPDEGNDDGEPIIEEVSSDDSGDV